MNSRSVVCVACGHTEEVDRRRDGLPGLSRLGHEQAKQRASVMENRAFDLVIVGNEPASTITAQAITSPVIPANQFLFISNLNVAWPNDERLQNQLADWVWARILMAVVERGARNTLVVGNKELLTKMALSTCPQSLETFRSDLQRSELCHAEGYILSILGTCVNSGERLLRLPPPAS